METPFIPPDLTNNAQLVFLTLIYGVVLYQASNLIASGSELLMLVPAIAGLVGSIVLPILGAVPDGMMVLFSGLGPNAQEEVSVGVGALAGSTVMLLTFPWFIAIVFGSVPLGKNGKPVYGADNEDLHDAPQGFMSSGISIMTEIRKGAKIMLMTTALFFIIQLPATEGESRGLNTHGQATFENGWAGIGLLGCVAAFCGYLVFCYNDANEDKQLAQVIKGIKKKQISIGAALRFARNTSTGDLTPHGGSHPLVAKDQKRLKMIMRPFFASYDYDKNGGLNASELKPLLHELGLKPTDKRINQLIKEADTDGDGNIGFDEFCKHLTDKFLLDEERLNHLPTWGNKKYMMKYDEEDEEEQAPEDLSDLPPDVQLKRVIFRSIWMMGLGTALVLVFSDPMVEVLAEWGNRLHVSPFYVSFILAPFASNASELLAAYTYAVKKSRKSITTSLSTLIGAACMNNTFCLGIFLALVYWKNLAWQFTAETIAMVLVQWIIGAVAITKKTHTTATACLILACYPGCLALVWLLENIAGWD